MNLKENPPSVLTEVIETQKAKESYEKQVKAVYSFYYDLLKDFGIKKEDNEIDKAGESYIGIIYWKLKEIEFNEEDYKLKISVRNEKERFYPDEKDEREPREAPIIISIKSFEKRAKPLTGFDKEKPLSVFSFCLKSEGEFTSSVNNKENENFVITLDNCFELGVFIENILSEK